MSKKSYQRLGWRKAKVPITKQYARRRKIGKAFVRTASKFVASGVPKQKAEVFLKSFLRTYGARYGAEALADQFATWGATRLQEYVGKRLVQSIQSPTLDVYSDTLSVPSISQTTLAKYTGSKWNPNSKTIKISFQSGKRPSRANFNCGKQNGVNKKVYLDTIRQTSITDAQRQAFTVSTGYNQKKQFMFDSGYTSFNIAGLASIFNFTGLTAPATSNQRVYANVHKMLSEIKITNINKYLPTYLKIHFFRYQQQEIPYLSLLGSCCNSVVTTQDSQEAMPFMYQLQPSVTVASTRAEVKVDPKTPGIMSAPEWKSQCEIVKSFSVKLNAGDILNLNHTHLCGSGIRLDKLFGEWINPTTSNTIPLTYGVMFEMYGPSVDAYRSTDNRIRYLGTGPGYLTFEFKRSITGALPPTSTSTENHDATYGGFDSVHFGIRVFQNETTIHRSTASKVLNWDEGSTAITIPVMSDLAEQDAGIIN